MKHVSMDEKGFSLVEVLIALTVLALGLLAVAQMQITSIRGNAFSSRTTIATTLAQDVIEDLMTLDYDDSELDGGDHTGEVSDPDETEGTTFTPTWNVQEDTTTFARPFKRINVTISWTDSNMSRTYSMQFVKAEARVGGYDF